MRDARRDPPHTHKAERDDRGAEASQLAAYDRAQQLAPILAASTALASQNAALKVQIGSYGKATNVVAAASEQQKLGIHPVSWLLLTLRGSCGQNHAALEKIEASSAMRACAGRCGCPCSTPCAETTGCGPSTSASAPPGSPPSSPSSAQAPVRHLQVAKNRKPFTIATEKARDA